jgi:hypothetical protein
VEQTGRPFKVRFKEHIVAIKGSKDVSMFDQHILNMGCASDYIEDSTKIYDLFLEYRRISSSQKFLFALKLFCSL